MTDIRQLYGEARALLQQAPTEELFFKICDLLAQAWEQDPAQTMAEFFPFVDDSLRSWPDHVRTCPPFWDDHFHTKRHYEDYEPLRLIRRIVFADTWGAVRIRAFGSSALAPCIKHVTLPAYTRPNTHRVQALCDGPEFDVVRELHIEENPKAITPRTWLPLLLDWPASRGTTMLKIHHYNGILQHVDSMHTFGEAFPKLEELWLMRTTLHGEVLGEMLSSPLMTALHEIDLGHCDIRGGLSVNLRAGRLIVRDANKQELLSLLGSGWMCRVKELKLEGCHLSEEEMESALDDFLYRATHLSALTLNKCHISQALAESIIAHKRATLRRLSGKKLKFQRGAKELLQTARWEAMESLKLK